MKTCLLSTSILGASTNAAIAQPDNAGFFRMYPDASMAPKAINIRTSNLIGMSVYAAETAEDAIKFDGVQEGWNNIGEINNVIITRDGMVQAVAVDIGGFLGVGERQVAVQISAIRFANDESTADDANDFFLVMAAAQADLESAPEYMMGDMSVGTDAALTDAATTDTSVTDDAVNETAKQDTMRDGNVMAEADYLTSAKLTGAAVYDAEDNDGGQVSDLILTEDGQVTQAVIDVGGFLGIGLKPVALPLIDIDILRNEAGDEVRVFARHTREELDAMPNYEG